MNKRWVRSRCTRHFSRRTALIIYLAAAVFFSGCNQQEPRLVPHSGIAFVSDRDGNWEIYIVQPDGSRLARLTDHPEVDADPAWSPDGAQIAFRSRRDGSSDIFTMSPDGSQIKNLLRDPAGSFNDEFSPAWNPDGKWLALVTDRFPPPPECPSAIHQLALFPLGGRLADIQLPDIRPGEQETFAWSPDGRYLAFSSGCRGKAQIYLWDRETVQTTPLDTRLETQTEPDWSEDGRFLAFVSNWEGNSEIYKYELETGLFVNLTQNPALDTHPSWSPDGTSLAFTSNWSGNQEIYVMSSDGSGLRNLTDHPAGDWDPDWSPIP